MAVRSLLSIKGGATLDADAVLSASRSSNKTSEQIKPKAGPRLSPEGVELLTELGQVIIPRVNRLTTVFTVTMNTRPIYLPLTYFFYLIRLILTPLQLRRNRWKRCWLYVKVYQLS
jgi:hypothetical protein